MFKKFSLRALRGFGLMAVAAAMMLGIINPSDISSSVTLPSSIVVAAADNPLDVYTKPGYHDVNGRKWYTTCEPYSQTTRCRTEIWATQTTGHAGGTPYSVTGWHFNNLTYLRSPRALWKNNPLGHAGTWWAADGNQWKTTCGTPETGRNACRSYVLGEVYFLINGHWTPRDKWIFNNIVLFG